MDKSDFIKLAPVYYALAIVTVVEVTQGIISQSAVLDKFTNDDPNDPHSDDYCYLEHRPLMKKVLDDMVAYGALRRVNERFGAPLFRRGEQFAKYIEVMEESDEEGPFAIRREMNDLEWWLRGALRNLNTEYHTLGVTDADLEKPEAEWEPIPLDQASPAVQKAIAAVDETVKQVEQSNGYSAQHPEERKYVLDSLRVVLNTLKTATSTSAAYLKTYGLAPLAKLTARFVDAVIGESAKETAKLIWNLIKSQIGP